MKMGIRVSSFVVHVAEVTIRFPKATTEPDLNALMHRITGVIARVANVDHQTVATELLTSSDRQEDELGFTITLQREYTDPAFPKKLNDALASIDVIDSPNAPTMN